MTASGLATLGKDQMFLEWHPDVAKESRFAMGHF
jgi:hypothetical protein